MLMNLQIAIRVRGLRQFEIARSLGVDAGRICEIIAGRRNPSPELRSRIAELLRADPDWLFCPVVVIPRPGSSGPEVVRAHDFAGSEV